MAVSSSLKAMAAAALWDLGRCPSPSKVNEAYFPAFSSRCGNKQQRGILLASRVTKSSPMEARRMSTGDVMKQQAEKLASALERDGLMAAVRILDPAFLCPFLVAAVLKRTRHAEAALEFFIWTQAQALEGRGDSLYSYSYGGHDVYVYNTMLASLLVDKSSSSAMVDFFEQMKAEGIEPDRDSYDLLVRGMCKSGDLDEAWKMVKEMISRGLEPNPLTCGNLVERLCSAKRAGEACIVFDELEGRGDGGGASIGMLAYNSILKVLLSLSPGELDTGLKISGDILLPRVLPYKTLLDCLLRTGRAREASDVVVDMVRRGSDGGGDEVTTYAALMSVLCKHNRTEDAARVVEMMEEREVVAGSGVYDDLVAAHCRTRRLEGAYRTFQSMVEKGYGLSEGTYRLLLRCLCEGGKFHIAFDIHRRGQAQALDGSTYLAMVNAACASGETGKAREVFEEVLQQHESSSSSSDSSALLAVANALVEGLCQASRVGDAIAFTAEMVERGWVPTIQTYNALIMGLCRAEEHERAMELFAALRDKGLA